MPLDFRCVVCDGREPARESCEACAGTGRFVIASCPRKHLTHDTLEFLMFHDLAEKNNWPVGGGLLDQTVAFFEGWRWMRNEEFEWKIAKSKE